MARNKLYPPSVSPGIPKLGKKPTGWSETSFGEALRIVKRPAEINDVVEYQLVTAKRNRGGIVPREILTGNKILTKVQYFVEKDDFLISKRQIVHGACGIVPESLNGALVSGEYSVLKTKSGLLLKYLEYLSHTVYFQQTCFQSSVGVDVEKMIFDLKGWLSYKIYLPPLPEQKKIVDIISAWDKSISNTEYLIERLQIYKKGFIQHLTTGNINFPGFGKQWKEMPLGKFLKPVVRKIIKPKESYLRLGIRSHGKGTFTSTVEDSETIAMTHLYQVKEGDLIVNITFAWEGAIAIVGQDGNGAFVSHRFPTYTIDTKIVLPEYFKYLMLSKRFFYELGLISPGGAGRNRVMSKTDFLKIRVNIPPIEEQIKIGGILTAIDDYINLLSKKLELVKKQKKVLIQKLLIGQIRVKV
jgi:type I restriction enzyme S subunit